MSRIISVVNQKGGVGKSTSAMNIATYLAHMGKFVLLVDMDPQANATSGVGIPHQELEQNVYHVLIDNTRSIKDILLEHKELGYRVAPSGQALAGANVELVNMDRREYRLHDALLEIRHDYDYIIIDSPPSLGLLTLNGIVAADEILVPVQCEYYALEGLGQLLNTIQLVQENLKPELRILGAVLTMYDKRNKLSDAVLTDIHQYFPHRVFRSVIPRSVRLAEAPSHGKTILQYDPSSKGGKAYERLAREIIETEQH